MDNIKICDKCKINTNYNNDTFVGIKCIDGDISINFQLGYHISENDKGLRKDILLLFSVLSNNVTRNDSEIIKQAKVYDFVQFPMQAYMYIIKDYLVRGYYTEQEVNYKEAKKGKINWGRTIKTQRPYICNDDIFYLNYITKNKDLKENELITLIHEYCVYDSFCKVGWLFTDLIPKKPYIKFNQRLFISTIKNKLSTTFNDRNRQLFFNMLAIIHSLGDSESPTNYRYGTYRFEYVWEKLIDKVFGITNKKEYFPKTTWRVKGTTYDNASLEPDTIMIYQNDIYVLDAKYYKFGVTNRVSDLPESTSINKQITYGEYIYNNIEHISNGSRNLKVYNAFIMPYNSLNNKFNCNEKIISIGEASGDWKNNDIEYQHIIGVLIDIKQLMSIDTRHDINEIAKLSDIILTELNLNRSIPVLKQ